MQHALTRVSRRCFQGPELSCQPPSSSHVILVTSHFHVHDSLDKETHSVPDACFPQEGRGPVESPFRPFALLCKLWGSGSWGDSTGRNLPAGLTWAVLPQDHRVFWLITGVMFMGSGLIWRRLLSFLGRQLEAPLPPVVRRAWGPAGGQSGCSLPMSHLPTTLAQLPALRP